MDRALRFIAAAVLAGVFSMPVMADDGGRLPRLNSTSQGHSNKAIDIRLRPSRDVEDTYTFALDDGVPSFFITFTADTTCYLITTTTDSWESGFRLLSGQYFPHPDGFFSGDTIVVKCATCTNIETATVNMMIYRGGQVNR